MNMAKIVKIYNRADNNEQQAHKAQIMRKFHMVPEDTLTAWPTKNFPLDPLTACQISSWPIDLTLTPVVSGSTVSYVVSPLALLNSGEISSKTLRSIDFHRLKVNKIKKSSLVLSFLQCSQCVVYQILLSSIIIIYRQWLLKVSIITSQYWYLIFWSKQFSKKRRKETLYLCWSSIHKTKTI